MHRHSGLNQGMERPTENVTTASRIAPLSLHAECPTRWRSELQQFGEMISAGTLPPNQLSRAKRALSGWEGPTRFIDDGCIKLDNNIVERSISPTTLNWKNALFAGSDGGAERWATSASLVETCKLNHVDPPGYLTDVLPGSQWRSQLRHQSTPPGAYQRQYLKAVA